VTTDSGAASYADLSLEQADPVLAALIKKELARQQRNIELIASENFTPLPVLQADGTVLNN
jgi:glycine hydroxymethyltransferase